MPRRYYRSRRTYPKQKWSINLANVASTVPAVQAQTFSVQQVNVVDNPSRTDTAGSAVFASSAILKVSRIRFKGMISSAMQAGQSCIVALMYLPELVSASGTSLAINSIGNSAFYCHPEWILAWTRLDYTNAAQRNEISLYSRLRRNLNPGDKIALVVLNVNYAATAGAAMDISGTTQYVCKNN